MSFLPINEQNQQAPQGQTTAAPNAMTPPPQSGGSAGAATGGAKTSASGTPTQFGSSASKLGDYLSANAPQIGQQASQIAGGLNQQYGQLQQGINDVSNQFGQQVSGGYAAPNQNLVNEAFSNPSQFASTPGNVSAFQAQYNNQYTGPQNVESFSPYSQIQGQVQNAVQQGGLLGSQAGLQSYLQGKSPNSTRAANTLDSLLLSGNPEAKQTVQNAGKQFNDLTGQLENVKTQGGQQVEQAKAGAESSKQAAQKAAQDYTQNFNNQLNQNLTNAQNQVSQYNAGIPAYQNQAQDLNSLINEWNAYSAHMPNFDVSTQDISNPYANFKPQQLQDAPTLNQVATPEQLATQQALSQLLGSNVGPLDVNSEVGGYQAPTLNFNPSQNAQDVTNNLSTSYQNTLTGLKNALPDAWMQRDVYPQLQSNLSTEYQNILKQLQKYNNPDELKLKPR